MRTLILGFTRLAVTATAIATAHAQAPDPQHDRQARVWAASCAACHGTDGRSAGGIPPVTGRDPELLYRTLLEFKNNQRPAATVMHQHTKGYTDEELRRIAQHFAKLNSK